MSISPYSLKMTNLFIEQHAKKMTVSSKSLIDTSQVKNSSIIAKDKKSKFVECDDCSMNSVCQPVSTATQSLNLSESYLQRRLSSKNSYILFHQATPLTDIYAVSSGTFKLCQKTDDGEENIIGLRFPGELIGEDALYLKSYNYTAIAIGDSSVCKVSVEQMTSCGKLVPEIQQNLIELLSRQSFVRQRNFQAYIGKKSADSLLAAFLLNIIERNADYTGSDNSIELPISRNDVANFLGLRRETLSRVFSKFQKEQLIQVTGKKIQLLEAEQLIKLADF
ncbi:MAG: helix-turn-helix domain-containing protein [Colwellia sp.]|nr:helix-turn-helix domain-containing protein [Colwellia sp.]MCW8865388.1 helix-turn-helix domain-containing protein [Colwellia sp.]MCW9079892.1 helix-turn-helix domain-containing protein [Colwellia sp.]